MASKKTGTSGYLIIEDNGTVVTFKLQNTSAPTFMSGKSWSGTVNGVSVGGTFSISGAQTITLGSWTVSSSQTVTLNMGATGTSGMGGPTSFSLAIARATVPATPGTPSVSQVTTTGMRLAWALPSSGGSALTQMLLRRSTVASFATYTDIPLGASVTSYVATGLTPDTTYYWRVFARNAKGYSNGSGVRTQSTLPAVAPGLTVTPNLAGTQASAALTPPGGATGVTKYVLERRVLGTTVPVTATESSSSPILQAPLTPGVSYQYRASAFFGTYQSPWTAWIAAVQPNPNTDPGAYFDGSTPDNAALDYRWTGTVNNSTSVAAGRIPAGWRSFALAAATSGGTGVIFQAAGGWQGEFSARYVFFTDTTAYGFRPGTGELPTMGLADVEQGGAYYGSVNVWPSRKQRLRPVIRWYDALGVYLSSSLGPEAVVEAGVFTRLIALDVAPAGAQWAGVVAENVAGTDGSLWLGGDWIHMDAAMVTLQQLLDYFDGDTPDTTQFAYAWTGDGNASPSTRTTVTQSTIDPLQDPDCPPIPAAPLPPFIDESCIEDVGSWRRYWLIIPEDEVYNWLSTVPTIVITAGEYAARQVRIRFYPNPDDLTPTQAGNLEHESEQIITYIPPRTTMTLDGVSESVWASVNAGVERNADHLLRGSNGAPPTWPVLSCGGAYLVSFDVPLDAPEGNIVLGASLTTRMM